MKFRQIHHTLAPIMLLPIVLTVITGTFYQMFDLAGQGDNVEWLLDIHKGHFGALNLEIIYPFLNAFGLLVVAATGSSMWLQMHNNSIRR
ncbi:PepSY domain-containing protein [Neosynechococcus sphagnicola]|nr:PepSY domain-containing protein [Neosynechococcus sphagnicola]